MKHRRYPISSMHFLGGSIGSFGEETVRREPMFFSAVPEYAHTHGGPITRGFVSRLMAEHPELADKRVVVDTKVAMLMPGWYPCIPGWHHDDVERSSPDGQPNYDTPSYRASHCMALVNAALCPTEFALGTSLLFGLPEGHVVYRGWTGEVDRQVAIGRLTTAEAPEATLIYFDDRTWHRGTQSRGSGWRWFGRASWDTGREVRNETRTQNQVYVPADKVDAGW